MTASLITSSSPCDRRTKQSRDQKIQCARRAKEWLLLGHCMDRWRLAHKTLQENEFQRIRGNAQKVKEQNSFQISRLRGCLSSSLDCELHEVRVLICSV